MKKLAIIGSGDLGQLIAYHAMHDKQFEVVGFFDDFAETNSFVNTIQVLGKISDIETEYNQGAFDVIICGIGYNHLSFREKLYNDLHNKVEFATIIHSSCYVDASCRIGKGVFMLPGSVLDLNTVIDDNVVINVSCTIAHDSKVGAHTFISPSVAIAGFVSIGIRCNIGINTTIIDNIEIVSDVQTGGGTVVNKNILNKGLYVGNPHRFIR
ncbi:acetyltransferase [Psychroserpens ponticola]|uniref:Acetyltransferase n=1 Tax=Psychroserpens ponticola TaxID=2932268 RepID=A0ABY7S3N9_9FLAO|nr:acetyltransferase [Psychroserpens ponticola]WCO02520.1 acetyltransferase [Psychroserpens ponticola]